MNQLAKRRRDPYLRHQKWDPHRHKNILALQAILETQNPNFLRLLNNVRTTSAAASQNISVTLPLFNPDVPGPMPQRGVKPWI